MPNMIDIGGIHVVDPPAKLPDDIQQFLDSATDGVILFSMGSMLQSVDWTVQQRKAFSGAFGKLKQKILWKYENETLPGNPGNIMIKSWIPQRDILAHPNVKLFLTHGGLLGTTEALYEGIPVLGIPIYGDQRMNMARAVSKGYGLEIDLNDITEELLTKNFNELLSNENFKKNAEEISKRFKDRPMSPNQSVVYWTEHVIRHHGANYLRSAGLKLNSLQRHLIDVYATIALIFLLAAWIGFKMIQFICKMIRFAFIRQKSKIN
jgi:glucuronosyltransferase